MSAPFDDLPRFPFTAATSNICTSVAAGVSITGTPVQVYTDGVLPVPLAVDTTYYAEAIASAGQFYLTDAEGVRINITTAGTAPNYIAKMPESHDSFGLPMIKGGFATMYKAPPPADKLQKDYEYDSVVGTLEADGGESWG